MKENSSHLKRTKEMAYSGIKCEPTMSQEHKFRLPQVPYSNMVAISSFFNSNRTNSIKKNLGNFQIYWQKHHVVFSPKKTKKSLPFGWWTLVIWIFQRVCLIVTKILGQVPQILTKDLRGQLEIHPRLVDSQFAAFQLFQSSLEFLSLNQAP